MHLLLAAELVDGLLALPAADPAHRGPRRTLGRPRPALPHSRLHDVGLPLPDEILALIVGHSVEGLAGTITKPNCIWAARGYFEPWSADPALVAQAERLVARKLGAYGAMLAGQADSPQRAWLHRGLCRFARQVSRWIRMTARRVVAFRLTSRQWDRAARPSYAALKKHYIELVQVLDPPWRPSRPHDRFGDAATLLAAALAFGQPVVMAAVCSAISKAPISARVYGLLVAMPFASVALWIPATSHLSNRLRPFGASADLVWYSYLHVGIIVTTGLSATLLALAIRLRTSWPFAAAHSCSGQADGRRGHSDVSPGRPGRRYRLVHRRDACRTRTSRVRNTYASTPTIQTDRVGQRRILLISLAIPWTIALAIAQPVVAVAVVNACGALVISGGLSDFAGVAWPCTTLHSAFAGLAGVCIVAVGSALVAVVTSAIPKPPR